MAKKEFDENSNLGFMRVFQAYNIIVIFVCLLAMLFVTGYTLTFSVELFQIVMGMVSAGVCVWLIGNRLAIARKAIIILLIADILVSIPIYLLQGRDFADIAINNIPTLLWILYFLTSRRAKAVLVKPFSNQTIAEEQDARDRELFDLKSKDFWLRILMYFFIFCVVGHWMEATFCRLVNLGIMPGEFTAENSTQFRDYLNPFPIYGGGFVGCALLLHPLKTFCMKKFKGNFILSAIVVFLAAFLIVGAAEFVFGVTCNADYAVWDYRNQPFNLMGQVCLSYTSMFAIAASIVVWVVYPFLEKLITGLNKGVFRLLFVVSLVLFAFLFITYTMSFEELTGVEGYSINGTQFNEMAKVK